MRALLAIAVLVCVVGPAFAEPVKIVAFGASNTFGKNLSRSSAYPSQLENLLRSRGHDVIVINAGTNGQTTAEEVARLDAAVPPDTRIVIFQPGGNDRRKLQQSETKRNIETILTRLQERRIQVLFSGGPEKRRWAEALGVKTVEELSQLAPGMRQPDEQHLTREGYGIVAEKLAPLVEEMLARTTRQ